MSLEHLHKRRTLASLLVLALSFPAFSQSQDAGVLDAPKVLKLKTGHYDFNQAAYDVIDLELRRLKLIAFEHDREMWGVPIAVSFAIGFVVGFALPIILFYALK